MANARDTIYWEACLEKGERMEHKDPWKKTRQRIAIFFIFIGWILFAMIVYQISQFDYEMANFDPYEILGVSLDADKKTIKSQYKKLSLIYHPDKPTGNEKLFMKLRKAYDALTDETARYNWEHYGNPDGPQAMQFGIGLPSWIVEEQNSLYVLGVYTLIFMIGLPTAVWYWWSRSIKFSGEQVLLDTTQLYYYFFHKTPHMMLRRVLMVLAASLEFERGHNSEVVERPTDNAEIPQLMKSLPNLGINNKEKPLCFGYSVKARALLFAHLSRIALPLKTLHQDRLFVTKKCPFLIHEMVTCISQLILLAHAGRIGRLPSLDTIEYAMKCSPLVVQALWDKSSPLLQLPHIVDDMLKHFHSRKRNIKTLQQLAKMKDEDRRSVLRSLNDDQYRDVIRVLALIPIIDVDVTTEVVDDEDAHVVTAGAIITVTVVLTRGTMESLISGSGASIVLDDNDEGCNAEDRELDVIDTDEINEISEFKQKLEDHDNNDEENEDSKKKTPVWKKPQKKKPAKKQDKNAGKQKKKQKPKSNDPASVQGDSAQNAQQEDDASDQGGNADEKPDREENSDSNSEDDSGDESGDEKPTEKAVSTVDEEEEEAEWERFQKKINKREKALEGKSKISHSVHCPFFPDDKQEFWWCYIADRKNHQLITPPNHVTSLIDREEVELKFTAPQKPGHYSFTVCLKSDSYLGVDVQEEIKLEVAEAKEPIEQHPQWEFEDDEEEEDSKEEESDDEFAIDSEADDDDE